MKILQIANTLFLCFFCHQISAQSSLNNKTTDGGEKLKWVISYNVTSFWTDVGEAKLEVKSIEISDKNLLHIYGSATTYPSYDVFFKLRDVYQTWVDPVNLKPMVFLRDVNEGGYTKKEKYIFHRTSNYANVSFQKNQTENEELKIPINENIFDAVSLLYVIRNLNYKMYPINTRFQQNILIDKTIKKISIEYLGKDNINTNSLGSYKCIKIRVYIIKEKQEKQTQYADLWLSDDENRVPLYMLCPLRVGSIQAKIIEMSGLKNEIKSKL